MRATESKRSAPLRPVSAAAGAAQPKKRQVEYVGANVVQLDLPTLVANASVATGEMLSCGQCAAAFSAVSKVVQGVWTCEFCSAENKCTLDEAEMPKTDAVDYLIRGPTEEVRPDEISIIFVVDVSGSMCVTTAVDKNVRLKGQGAGPGADVLAFREAGAQQLMPNERQGTTYISRLQCVQAAVESQIENLRKRSLQAKVGVVSFCSEVTVVGDGSKPPVTITGDRLNNEAELLRAGAEVGDLRSVSESAAQLVKSVYGLDTNGSTALGPSLCVAMGMLKGAAPGSKIILCTDGLANLGVGSIEDIQDLTAVADFYKKIATQAKQAGYPISVVAIAGSQCKMEILGSIAELSGGDMDIVEAAQVLDKFSNLADEHVIATNVELKLFVHKHMTIIDALKPDVLQTATTRDIGTVLPSTTASFEFRVREELVGKTKEDKLPFQVQIKYTRVSDGSVLVRVQTLEQAVTADKEDAEKEIDVEVVASNAVQQAAHYAASGNYSKARQHMVSNQKMMQRSPMGNSSSPMYAPAANNSNNNNPLMSAPAPSPGYAQFVEQAQELDDLLMQQERQEAPAIAESEHMSSRASARSDAVSNAIYKSKRFVAKK